MARRGTRGVVGAVSVSLGATVLGTLVFACNPQAPAGAIDYSEGASTEPKKPVKTKKDAGAAEGPATTQQPTQSPTPSNGNDAGVVVAAPTLSGVTPSSAAAGSQPSGMDVTLSGTGFGPGAAVDILGTRLLPSAVTPTSMTVRLPPDKLATAAALQLVVVAAPPNQVNSNAVMFTVTSAQAPTLSSLNPSQAQARTGNGGTPLTLTVNGNGFDAGTVVVFNGTDVPTTPGGTTTLTAQVPVTLLRNAGNVNVTVRKQGQLSTPLTFTLTQANNGGGNGVSCNSLGLPEGYCVTAGNYAGYYCQNGVANLNYAVCPYGAGGGGYATCADAGVYGYGCVASGPYAGTLCSNGLLYEDAACAAAYGNNGGNGGGGGGGNGCYDISCVQAGLQPGDVGCIVGGIRDGDYCASNGCVQPGQNYGCTTYGGGGGGSGGGGYCSGATCADYGLYTGECVYIGNDIAQCDGSCMYYGCN